MTSTQLPAPEPVITPETKPFWDATAAGRLTLQRCTDCGVVIWYPRSICPECSGTALELFEAVGTGTIYSYTVNYRGSGAYRDYSPYVLAYVELDEGPRLMTNIIGTDPDAVRIGMPVRVVFTPTAAGNALVRFAQA
jgi:uncharacterized protein